MLVSSHAQQPIPVAPWGTESPSPGAVANTRELQREEAEIRTTITEMVTYANAHDLDGYLRYFWQSPELQIVTDGAEIRGWADLKAGYGRSYPDRADLGIFSLEKVKVQHLGPGLALTVSWWTVTQAGGQRTYCSDSSVFRRFSDGWKVITEHSCTFTP
jgi:ketosteroid isomerase-like protein